jgi:hypothetical protein
LATFGICVCSSRTTGGPRSPTSPRGRRRIGDHRRYLRDLPDGTRLRTKISHDERAEIGQDLFHRILRDQLQVTEERFWEVVQGRAPRAEGQEPVAEPIPGWLVTRLLFAVGMSEAEIAHMTTDEAQAVWADYQARPRAEEQ